MNPVLMFVVLALGLTAVVVIAAWWQLARAARQARDFDWARENAVEAPLVQVFREQLADLQAQRQQGELSDAEFERAKTELESRLLADIEADGGHGVNANEASNEANRARLSGIRVKMAASRMAPSITAPVYRGSKKMVLAAPSATMPTHR